jgi:hypothetical protein
MIKKANEVEFGEIKWSHEKHTYYAEFEENQELESGVAVGLEVELESGPVIFEDEIKNYD